MKLDYTTHNSQLTIQLSQQAFIQKLAELEKLDEDIINFPTTPYRSGYPIDTITPTTTLTPSQRLQQTKHFQSLVGSLNWLSISTRPDIATATNLLAKHSCSPSPGHIDAARRVTKYLLGTKDRAITFTQQQNESLNAFIKFPIPTNQLTALTDANWGPQDQSIPSKYTHHQPLDLFKTRSLSGYVLFYGRPIHWSSKRQSLTARSSAEAEIVATDECTK